MHLCSVPLKVVFLSLLLLYIRLCRELAKHTQFVACYTPFVACYTQFELMRRSISECVCASVQPDMLLNL